MALDGWTKIGDQIEGTGKWTLYRHRGLSLSSVDVIDEIPADKAARAARLYGKKAGDVRRGGLWLVSPEGRVCGATFIRP